MDENEQLVLIFGSIHVIAIAFGVLLFVMFLRSDPAPSHTPPGDDDSGGGGGPRVPVTPPTDRPGGGVPLPDATPARARLRGPGRIADTYPPPERRPLHPPERVPEHR